jgi:hypothetical protein
VNSTRTYLRHIRTFFLQKEGVERLDSRSVGALACRIDAVVRSARVVEHEPIVIDATVRNTGKAIWLPIEISYGGVALGAHAYDADGKLLAFDLLRQPLTDPSREIAPGEEVACTLTLSPQAAGRYIVELDCVAARVIWFSQVGSPPARLVVDVSPA